MLLGVTIGQGEWLIILVVLLLLFGSTQLPKLARSLGSAQKEFRKGMKEGDSEDSNSEDDDDENAEAEATAASSPKAKSRRLSKS